MIIASDIINLSSINSIVQLYDAAYDDTLN